MANSVGVSGEVRFPFPDLYVKEIKPKYDFAFPFLILICAGEENKKCNKEINQKYNHIGPFLTKGVTPLPKVLSNGASQNSVDTSELRGALEEQTSVISKRVFGAPLLSKHKGEFKNYFDDLPKQEETREPPSILKIWNKKNKFM